MPIECEKDKVKEVQEEIKKLGDIKTEIKKSNIKDDYLITDNGNYLLFAWFDNIKSDLEEKLLKIDGILESGLFIGYDIIIIK